jgi:hypothetical protein
MQVRVLLRFAPKLKTSLLIDQIAIALDHTSYLTIAHLQFAIDISTIMVLIRSSKRLQDRATLAEDVSKENSGTGGENGVNIKAK